MVIKCTLCGRPLAGLDVPAIDENEAGRLLRSLGRFGINLPPEVAAFLNPTPELIEQTFNPRHPNGCTWTG